MDQPELEEKLNREAGHGLTEYVRYRMCSVGDGTGNMLKYGDRFFIATCKHVADDYFSNSRPYVILRGNIRLYSEHLRYVAHSESKYDIALIEITSDFIPSEYYELESFNFIEDFRDHDFSRTNIFICGLPSGLSFEKDEGIFRMWMSYMTLPHDTKTPDADFIFGKYDTLSEENIISKGLRTKLPRASGLSGAFILSVTQFEGSKEEIWLPNEAKVIAMQISWLKSEGWFKGVNIVHLKKLIDGVAAMPR